uniref:Uncharacterized protein n=1 Tax=Triticum urartu TaxID=4572 RepID=A0A8R7UVZ9_TRIUA
CQPPGRGGAGSAPSPSSRVFPTTDAPSGAGELGGRRWLSPPRSFTSSLPSRCIQPGLLPLRPRPRPKVPDPASAPLPRSTTAPLVFSGCRGRRAESRGLAGDHDVPELTPVNRPQRGRLVHLCSPPTHNFVCAAKRSWEGRPQHKQPKIWGEGGASAWTLATSSLRGSSG